MMGCESGLACSTGALGVLEAIRDDKIQTSTPFTTAAAAVATTTTTTTTSRTTKRRR